MNKMCNGPLFDFLKNVAQKFSLDTLTSPGCIEPDDHGIIFIIFRWNNKESIRFFRRTLNFPTEIKYCAINDIDLYRYCDLWHLMCLFQHQQKLLRYPKSFLPLFSLRKCPLQHELMMFEIYVHACMKQMIILHKV